MKYLVTLFITAFTAISLQAQVIDIADARVLPEETVVTVTGVLTNGAELGIIRYFQDGTGGLAAYGSAVTGSSLGDSVTVTGALKLYNGLLEIDPITDYVNHGPAVNPIEPLVISPNAMDEDTEAILTTINNCIFTDGGATFTGNNSYNFTSNGQTATVYIRNNHPLVGDLIPIGPVDLTGIVSQFTFTGFGGYQLLLRGPEDISSPNPLNIISTITLAEMTANSLTFEWITDNNSSTEAFYTADIDAANISENNQTSAESVTVHSLTLNGLEPGEVYFLQVFSVAGEDTARSNVFAAATISNSTGTMEAYFNGAVDNSYAIPTENTALATNLRDTIIAYINRAETTLDLAIYNINNFLIVEAINAAIDRGVTIRYIAEGQNANIGLAQLDETIPVLLRQNATGSGMHNKFVIVDYASENGSYVLTGSTNFTNNNLFTDLNNLVILQDKALAKAFTIEFNEMWGSSGSTPLPQNSRFGSEKINNTPQKFIIGGKEVELFFSPSDGTNSGILQTLESANASIDFALMLLTQNDLATKIIEKSDNFFVNVSGVMNDVNNSGSDFEEMVNAGVYVIEHSPEPVLHHKYVIVDHADFSSDPIVLTGSHNWSASANIDNDENTLIIHDANMANLFYQEYMAIFNGLTVGIEEATAPELKLYPNPAVDVASLVFEGSGGDAQLMIVDLTGKPVYQMRFTTYSGANKIDLNITNLPQGIYTLSLTGSFGRSTEKLVVVGG